MKNTKLTRNFPLKIMSVLIGFLIWFIVVNVDNPVSTKSITIAGDKVELQNTAYVDSANMIWKLLWLFLVYSFAGWALETVLASLKQKKFANRGIINGPFCLVYGFGGFFITAFTRELTGIWLFIGSAIVASLVEWIAGHLIEIW